MPARGWGNPTPKHPSSDRINTPAERQNTMTPTDATIIKELLDQLGNRLTDQADACNEDPTFPNEDRRESYQAGLIASATQIFDLANRIAP